MEITEGEYDTVKVRDEMGCEYRATVVHIEDGESLSTAFTDFSDKDFYIHVRFIDRFTDDHIIENYPEERIVKSNENALKPPVIRIRWEEVEQVYDD